MTEKMTVHQALCELKTLNARITSGIEGQVFVFANKHANTKVCGVDIGKYCEEIKSAYQSVTDLIARRDAIKRAVTTSNATTAVSIGGKEYTVAEAIEMKNNSIPLKQMLLREMNRRNTSARAEAERNNGERLEQRADEYIKSMYGNVDMKGASDEVKKVRADFITAQTMEIVDPLGINEEMKKLEKEINEFVVNIDAALSVSNALKELTIEY